MRKIDRYKEPDFWADYKNLHPDERYGDLQKTKGGNEVRHKLRQYLLQSQHGLCAYCCKKIKADQSLNEHMKPQSAYPQESMCYDNLIVSCKTEGADATCGVKKGNDYEEKLFISPTEPDCGQAFAFYPNGQIEGIGKRGKYMCELLNLDAYELRRARMAQYKIYASYGDTEMVHKYFLLPDENGELEPYPDMIQFFYDRGDFDIVYDE